MLTDKQALGFKDVLISPEPSDIKSRKEVCLEREFTFTNGLKRTLVPIVAANMQGIGTFKTARVLSEYKLLTCLDKKISAFDVYKFAILHPKVLPYLAITAGLNDFQYLYFIFEYFGIDVDFICLDVANGYMKEFHNYVAEVKRRYPTKVVIAGNVATREGADALYKHGADIIKVGIGSGSVCTTRHKTGVGVPQITAIDECSRDIGSSGFIMSDGGCTCPGDVAKAFVAGADFVMLGGMLAGTEETGSIFQGSAFTGDREYKTSEGKRIDIQKPLQSLDDRIKDILGGLRSTGSYIGQRQIENFFEADLIQVTEQTNDIFGEPE